MERERHLLPPQLRNLLKPEAIERGSITNLTVSSPDIIAGLNNYYKTRLAQYGIQTIQDLANLTDFEPLKDDIDVSLLRKWTLIAQILVKYKDLLEKGLNFEEYIKKAKIGRILLLGLDGAGKTSSLETIQKMKTVAKTQPTMGLEVKTLVFANHELVIYDLGGQKQFIDIYLSDPQTYFQSTLAIVYFIDVQMPSRFKESLDFLENIVNDLQLLGEDPSVHIFLHKFDNPSDKTLQASKTDIKNRVTNLLTRLKIKYYRIEETSIYQIPRLVSAFSRVFQSISSVTQVLNDTLRFYAEMHNILGIMLLTKNGMIIAEYTARFTPSQRIAIYHEILEYVNRFDIQQKLIYSKEPINFVSEPDRFTVNILPLKLQSYSTESAEQEDYPTNFIVLINDRVEGSAVLSPIEIKESITPWLTSFILAIQPPNNKK